MASAETTGVFAEREATQNLSVLENCLLVQEAGTCIHSMVSRITLLEPHFEGAQIGPESIDSETFDRSIDGELRERPKESSTSKSRGTILVQGFIGFVLVFLVVYASLRALSSSDEESS